MVLDALQDTLDELDLEYLDVGVAEFTWRMYERRLTYSGAEQLYLMHWPVAFKSIKDIYNLFPTDPEDPNFVLIDDNISIRDTWKG